MRSPTRARTLSLTSHQLQFQNMNLQQINSPKLLTNAETNTSIPAYKKDKLKIPSIEDIVRELDILRKENQELKKTIATLQLGKSYSPENSDEEEKLVAEETAWIVQKNKTNRNKKRKATESPEKENCRQSPKQPAVKQQRPPPVIVSNVNNYAELESEVKDKISNFKTTMMNNNQIKFNVSTESDYRAITKLMNEKSAEWHTYENKQTRPIRVMARNLHHSCRPEEIKDELEQRGFKVIEVVNKYKKATDKNGKVIITRLPLFMLTFSSEEDIKKIFKIEFICHMKVKIEAVRSSKLVPQCKKCQRYGHTQKFCARAPKCVKCAGDHLTATCQKPIKAKPQCSNCGKDHPASYRGCEVAKELQKRRDLAMKPRNTQIRQPREFTSALTTEGRTYSQATQITQQNQNEQQPLLHMIQTLLTKFEAQERAMNSISERVTRIENINNGAVARKSNY